MTLRTLAYARAVLPRRWRRWQRAWHRWSLWGALVALVLSMLVTLVWLAGRHEASVVQGRLDRDAADAAADVRTALTHNAQNLLALQAGDPDPLTWETRAAALLATQRELVRIEWRDPVMNLHAHAQTPYRPLLSDALERLPAVSDIALVCANAQRTHSLAYASSYFQPLASGSGAEMLELCLPLAHAGQPAGFVIATYSLQAILSEVLAPTLSRSQEASFTELDGTRLALVGATRRGTRLFSAQQLLDLPGNTLMLRLDGWHSPPSALPDVLSATVTAMAIALVSILVILVRDNRRRLRAESDLGDALAFRKAMENSLVTGLCARDLGGRITYVNPAFCAMVGFGAPELLGQTAPPYWPPECAHDHAARQALPPAAGGREAVFMRQDGTRFPVMAFEAPLINAQGRHTGWMGSFLDVSEQRRIEELSRTSQERLQATARLATVGEMASLLSHELNQPLAAIASYAHGSLNLLDPADAAPEPPGAVHADLRLAMQRIAQQAERAGKVIKSVHDFVRRRDHRREPVAVAALLDAVLPLIRLQADKLHIRVQLDLAAGLPPVLCDRTMVEQVLLNLARNAMQAMEDAPPAHRMLALRMHLDTRQNEAPGARRWLVFQVADQGPGISAEVAAQLFTPLFTTRAEGMGLGLSLCRTVVEQHGGQLGHAPHTPRGTVFTFTLACAP